MENQLPLVSVIIPAYNRAETITLAIDSALAQTYKNIELIVVDDGSSDNTKETLTRYGGSIKYIHKSNGGCSSARNAGIKTARGEYIAFLDSDDAWYPHKLEKQMSLINSDGGYGLAISEIEFVNNKMEHLDFSNIRKMLTSNEFALKHLLGLPPVVSSYLLIRKDVFSEVGLFDETLETAEDLEIMLRICSKFKGILADEPLVKYRKSADSISHKLFTGNRLRALEKLGQYAPGAASTLSFLIQKAKSKIHLAYAEDLLWNKYIKEAQKQLLMSLRDYFSFCAIGLLIKSWLMQALSPIMAKYKDRNSSDDR
jgi:glycosyltransferase involved in cell wall biosynthesis